MSLLSTYLCTVIDFEMTGLTKLLTWSLSIFGLGYAGLVKGEGQTASASPWGPSVTVKNGTYIGVHSPEYNQDFFLGMRYAQVCSDLNGCPFITSRTKINLPFPSLRNAFS